MANQFVWVDIPVTDLDRAAALYSAVLGGPVTTQGFGGMSFALLPGVEKAASGRAIAGASLGRAQALFVGLGQSDRFGAIGAFSA